MAVPTLGGMTTSQNTSRPRTSPITALETEWGRLNHCPRTLEVVNSWALSDVRFWSLDEVLRAAGYRGNKCDHLADQVLASIVRRAASDPLAARIVLQRVLPPIVAIARRRGKLRTFGFDAALGLTLSHAWEVIRTYPIERRPAKIAANIVRDIEYFAFVRENRRRPVNERLDDNRAYADMLYSTDLSGNVVSRTGSAGGPAPEQELAELIGEARRNNVSERSLQILLELGTSSIDEFAKSHGITPRTARTWRRDAVNELRERTQCAA